MLYNIFPIPLHQVFMVFRFLGIISREAKVILRKKRFSFKVYVINRLTVRKKIFCVVQGMFFYIPTRPTITIDSSRLQRKKKTTTHAHCPDGDYHIYRLLLALLCYISKMPFCLHNSYCSSGQMLA